MTENKNIVLKNDNDELEASHANSEKTAIAASTLLSDIIK